MTHSVQFGFCVPIFANPGMSFFRTPCYERLDWKATKNAVLECEKLGYDSLFVADHVFLGRDGAIFEGWTLLSAFAGMTKRMLLAPIHLCDSFRNPALTAKMVATLDVVSGGRFLLFYDYGWRRAEFDAYGFPFGVSDEERAARMEEGLNIIKGMLTEERFTFEGRFYRVKEALCAPKPVSRPLPPIWMGETNNPVMVRAIAKHADVFNSMPASVEGFRKKLDVVGEACSAIGRDFGSLGLSLETQILVCRRDSEIDACFERMEKLRPRERSDEDILAQMKATNPALESYGSRKDLEKEFLIGTPDVIVDRLKEYVALGVEHFMLWFMDFPSLHGIRLFAAEVMPKVRSRGSPR
ncbi:MAG TPA: LLM class flavin-dependent oxidoreductase [Vicinamibacteria bacterium]|nr:LLM class flavin-dependent oxidoreductase [Vicinamibacteria bacterium]